MLETDDSTKKRSSYDFEAPSFSLHCGFNSDECSQSQQSAPFYDNPITATINANATAGDVKDEDANPVSFSEIIILAMTPVGADANATAGDSGYPNRKGQRVTSQNSKVAANQLD